MKYAILALLFIAAIIFSFMFGFNFAIKGRAKDMIEKMNMGTIIFDFRPNADKEIQCEFDKSPRQMVDKDFVLMEVKIRR